MLDLSARAAVTAGAGRVIGQIRMVGRKALAVPADARHRDAR